MKNLSLLLAGLLLTIYSFTQGRYISVNTKKIVYARDGGMCRCCGSAQQLEYDHIIPYSCGGKSIPSNIQLLCLKCNRSKSNGCYCKIHDRKVGSNCCDGKTTTVHTTGGTQAGASRQCTGTTKKGSRCRNRTTDPSGRCHLHD